MNKKLYAGISQIVLGILIAIAPQTFAHVCAVKETPMACHYTAQAALGIGIVIVALGIVGLLVSDQTRAGLDLANAVLGVLTIAVPTVLIGVCKGAMMRCHMVTLPTLIVLGVLLVSSIAGVIVHIPAGIGVLEAVFIAMLSGEEISRGAIIAALLAYRALYYFLPLLLATIGYLILESRAKHLREKNQRKLAGE